MQIQTISKYFFFFVYTMATVWCEFYNKFGTLARGAKKIAANLRQKRHENCAISTYLIKMQLVKQDIGFSFWPE